MMNRYLIGALSAAVLTVGSIAFAQTASPMLTGTVTPEQTTSGTVVPGATGTGTIGINDGLGVMFNVAQSIPAGGNEEALALIALDGSRSTDSIAVPEIPMEMVFSGATPDEFTNCSLRNVNDLGTALNTGANALGALPSSASAITFDLDSPILVPAGSSVVLALTCDVAPQTPQGATVTVGINPAAIPATDAVVGGTVVPAADMSAATGQPIPTYGTVTITSGSASSSSPSNQNSGTSNTAPGVPNTGAGGEAPLNDATLAISAAVALFGLSVLARRFRAQHI